MRTSEVPASCTTRRGLDTFRACPRPRPGTGSITKKCLHLAVLLMLVAATVLLTPQRARAQGWYDTNWACRRAVTVSNPGATTLTAYQVQITLNSSFTFAAAKSDGSDVRLTSSDGTTAIPFWIESWSSGTQQATVWANVPTVPTSGTTVYLYYGNAAATAASNGTATFELFDDFESWVAASSPWTDKAPMPTAIADLSTAVYNNKLYSFGGYGNGPTDPVDKNYEYDPGTNAWTERTPMPTARWGMAAVEFDGLIYVFGGSISSGAGNVSKNEVYDPVANSWATKADIPAELARQGVMGVKFGNRIHLFYESYHYEYDPATDSYTSKANVPNPRFWCTSAVVGSKIYLIGGHHAGVATNDNQEYTPATDSWATRAPLPISLWGATRDNPVINGKIYVTHGLDGSAFHTSNYVYDPSADTWEQKGSAVHARDGVSCGVVNNKLYVIGGRADFGGPYGLIYNEVYDPLLDTGAPPPPGPSLWATSGPGFVAADAAAKYQGSYGLVIQQDADVATQRYAQSIAGFGSAYALDFYWNITDAGGIGSQPKPQGLLTLTDSDVTGSMFFYNAGGVPVLRWYTGSAFNHLQNSTWNSWHKVTVVRDGANSRVVFDGSPYQSPLITPPPVGGTGKIKFGVYFKTKQYLDNVRVRKWAGADPATSVGAEQPQPAPAAPVAGAATGIATNGFTAHWSAVDGAASYRLDVATDSGFSGILPAYSDLTVGGLSQVVSGLSAGTAYYYRVRAVNGGGPSVESNTITVTTTATDLVAAQPPYAAVISTVHACVTVPVVFTRTSATPMRGYSVTVRLSGNLLPCGGGGGGGIQEGPYLRSQGGSTLFQVTDHHDGSYTVDSAILGAPCGVTGSGTLFTVGIGSSDSGGSGTITVTAATARDCGNAPVPGMPGAPGTIPIDNVGPVAVSALVAVRVQSGNDADGTTKVAVSFAMPEDGAEVEVYRAPYGNYPEYDDGASPGAEPPAPVYPPGEPWVLTPITASGQSDEVATRDVWYWAVFARDAAGNLSAAARSAGTLNYHLGDVSDGATAGMGDNHVIGEDISLLGAHYGAMLSLDDPLGYLDVGPTTNSWIDGRPVTDNRVEFEDLVMFGLNYAAVSKASPRPAAASSDVLLLDAPAQVRAGETVEARVRMRGTGQVFGLSVALTWDPAKVTPLSVMAGDLASANGAVVLSPGPGVVDATVLGTGGGGMTGDGELAVFRFRAVADGVPGITVAAIKARDARNSGVTLPFTATTGPGTGGAPPPALTQLAVPQPNPFSRTSTISFSLAEAGAVDLALYSASGARVRTLARGSREPGIYAVIWDGRDDGNTAMAAGVYYVRLTTGRGQFSRRIVCIR